MSLRVRDSRDKGALGEIRALKGNTYHYFIVTDGSFFDIYIN